MRIAITGSGGFIGKHLVKALSKLDGVSIISIDISTGIDLTKDDSIDTIPPFDVMIHLACLLFIPDSFERPREFYQTNYLLTLNALELCRKNKAKMIYISSYVYGEPDYLPIDEKHTIKANNPYTQTKIIGEQLCQGYHRDFGIPCIILRPINIFGPGQRSNFLIASIIAQIKSTANQVFLKDPAPKRDYLYIDDFCDAISKAVLDRSSTYEVYNIAYGESFSVETIVQALIARVKDRKITLVFAQNERRTGEIMDVVGDCKKIKQQLGWEPKTNFIEGLELTLKAELEIE